MLLINAVYGDNLSSSAAETIFVYSSEKTLQKGGVIDCA